MAKRNRIIAINYDELSAELKSRYNEYKENFRREGIYELRERARDMNISSVTTFKKSELVDRMVEVMMSDHVNSENVASYIVKMRDALLNDSRNPERVNGKTFEGYFVTGEVDGYILSGAQALPDLFVPQGLINDRKLRCGTRVEVKAREVLDGRWGVYQINGQNSERNFDDLTPVRPGHTFKLPGGSVDVGGRAITRPFTYAEIGAVKSSVPSVKVIALIIDELPENVGMLTRSLNEDCFYLLCDRPVSQQERLALQVLEICKRYVETGDDVLLIVRGLDTLGDDVRRKIFGSGRCFKKGSLTVAAQSADPALIKIATDK